MSIYAVTVGERNKLGAPSINQHYAVDAMNAAEAGEFALAFQAMADDIDIRELEIISVSKTPMRCVLCAERVTEGEATEGDDHAVI